MPRDEVLRAVAAAVPGLIRIDVANSGESREYVVAVALEAKNGTERRFTDRMPQHGSVADLDNVIRSLNHRIERHG